MINYVTCLGKGQRKTYWLLRANEDVPIRKKDNHSKLKPFFRQPRSLQQGGGVPVTPEVRR